MSRILETFVVYLIRNNDIVGTLLMCVVVIIGLFLSFGFHPG